MASDLASLLASRTRRRPGEPLVTFVDVDAGERTELSATSAMNAAAKIGNAIIDEFDLMAGDRIALHMPPHWQLTTWCLGTWLTGCTVTLDDDVEPDLIVSDLLHAPTSPWPGSTVHVVSTHPLGLPITSPLPDGCEDVTVTIRQQPDAYLHAPSTGTDIALASVEGSWSQSDLIELSRKLAHDWGLAEGGRLLLGTSVGHVDDVVACAAIPLVMDASVTIVRGGDNASLARIAEQERTTCVAGL